jgi:DNA-directed RNA polymerase specialized sigma24 family protein
VAADDQKRVAPSVEAHLKRGPEQGAPVLAVLYAKHCAELIRYVRRSFGLGPADAEDVVQAAFTHFGALAQPHLVDNPRAFLYRASRNFVVDQRRRALVRARAAQRGDLTQLL